MSTFEIALAAAQDYHLEFTNNIAGPTWITLVNDSQKPIEAFRLSQRCAMSGSVMSTDILDFSGYGTSAMHSADGRISRRRMLEFDDRWDAGLLMTATSHNRTEACDAEVEAVIFSDGSYEGKEAVARDLKARRDGLRDSINDWIRKIQQTESDGLGLESIRSYGEEQVKQDQAELNKFPYFFLSEDAEPPLHAYWSGRNQVDINLRSWSDPTRNKVSANLPYLANEAGTWKRKIDNDEAMKVLDSQFPPISETAER